MLRDLLYIIQHRRMLKAYKRDSETKTIRLTFERAPCDSAVAALHTPYRLQFVNTTRRIARFLRVGYCQGGQI